MAEAEKSGLYLTKIDDITEQVLQGIESKAARYDKMHISFVLFKIRLGRGTRSCERFLKREKMHVCACWQNYKRIKLD